MRSDWGVESAADVAFVGNDILGAQVVEDFVDVERFDVVDAALQCGGDPLEVAVCVGDGFGC